MIDRVYMSHHVTDSPVAGDDRTRKIGKYLNYSTPAGIWASCNIQISEAPERPYDWSGAYEFSHASREAPLQLHFGDTTRPEASALVGLRLSDRPDCWANIKALGDNPSVISILSDGTSANWSNLWNNADLELCASRHLLSIRVVCLRPEHPTKFRFALKLPECCRFSIENDTLSILNEAGDVWLSTRPTWAKDAEGTPFPVRLVADGTETIDGVIYPVFAKILDGTSLAKAVYPLVIDPTAVISGTTDTEDNTLFATDPDANYGGLSYLYVQNFDTSTVNYGTFSHFASTILRLNRTQIPNGTISGFRYLFESGSPGWASTMDAFILKDANSSWVEGTAVGALQAGSSCSRYAVYNTTSWAGWPVQSGATVSGVDYDSDASPPSITITSTGVKSFALKPEWATAWRDQTRANAGMILHPGGVTCDIFFGSSETGAGMPPYYEIDYTSGAAVGHRLVYWRVPF